MATARNGWAEIAGRTRDAWRVRVGLEVEHGGGISLVKAAFRHEHWDTSPNECSAKLRARSFFRGYPRRASVVLTGTVRDWEGSWGRHVLSRLAVLDSDGLARAVKDPPPLEFFVPYPEGLPGHEARPTSYVQGDEVKVEVRVRDPGGVREVRIEPQGGYGLQGPPQKIGLQGKGGGHEECTVVVKGRVGDSKAPGRYRAKKMKVLNDHGLTQLVRGRNPLLQWSTQELNPPLVFEVHKNPAAQEKEETIPKPRNWGFASSKDTNEPPRDQ